MSDEFRASLLALMRLFISQLLKRAAETLTLAECQANVANGYQR